MDNGANGTAYLRVDFAPKMTRTVNSYSTVTRRYVSEFVLPYGSFIAENVNTQNIDIPVDDVTVNLGITDSGALRIEIIGFEPFTYNGQTYNYPVAKIGASVTTFNKEMFVNIGDNSLFAAYELT